MTQTLNQLLKEHPEYGDLPVAIYCSDGSYDFVGGRGSVYISYKYDEQKECDTDIPETLVFSPN